MSNNNWKKIWKFKVPPRVTLFLWKLENNILPTKKLLENKVFQQNFDASCNRCKLARKSHDHIFWECGFAKQVWNKVFHWWRYNVDIFKLHINQKWKWLHWFKSQSLKIGWSIAMISTLWSLWLSRNEAVFKGEFLSVDHVIIMSKFRAKSWCEDIGLVMAEDDCIWNINPAGIVLKNF